MPYEMSLKQQAKLAPSQKQTQKLIMLPKMQQAIQMLQLPIMELNAMVEEEMQKNPLLEQDEETNSLASAGPDTDEKDTPPEKEMSFDERNLDILRQLDEDFRDHFEESGNYYMKRTNDEEKKKTFQESMVRTEVSLFEFLMQQAKETFIGKEHLSLAEQMIGNFDENGFLTTPLKEIAALNHTTEATLEEILKEIQQFEPFGVGAKSLQESFLIQLERKNKKRTLAYTIISQCYDELLHNRIPAIKKKLGCSMEETEKAIEQIAKLDLHPGLCRSTQVTQAIFPDINLRLEDDKMIVEINDDRLPSLHINRKYMRLLDDEKLPKETKDFIKSKILSAKWLMRNIHQRNDTLTRIVEFLAKEQKEFFIDPDGKLHPMTMKQIAEELDLHESTIARAVSNKYINCPRGLLSMRSFFTATYVNEKGEDISAKTVKDALKELIDGENKSHPLSDETLSAKLLEKGIKCARRTIAKYRIELNFGNATQRKKFRS